MIRSYKVKLYPNRAKAEKLNAMLARWTPLVNEKIHALWPIVGKSAHPPLEHRLGSAFIRRAADRAWKISKTSRILNPNSKPEYSGYDLDFGQDSCSIEFSSVGHFDGWIRLQVVGGRRISLPFKSYSILNSARNVGVVSRSISIIKCGADWFAILFVKTPITEPKSIRRIGIDVGVNTTAMTSTGCVFGVGLKELRIKTRHRKYRHANRMPYRQQINRIARAIINQNENTDFAVESLNFKGKSNRPKIFRSRLSNFAYGHLANRLEQLGESECFRVIRVNPAYTSQTCPQCGNREKQNRNGDAFVCLRCGHSAHSDLVGAININGGKAVLLFGGAARVSEGFQNLAAKENIQSDPTLNVSAAY